MKIINNIIAKAKRTAASINTAMLASNVAANTAPNINPNVAKNNPTSIAIIRPMHLQFLPSLLLIQQYMLLKQR